MKPRMFTAFVLVVSLALLPAVSTSAQRSDRAVAPPSSGDQGPQSVNAPAVTLGQPGLSFRYVQTFGVTEQAYTADAQHLNGPNFSFRYSTCHCRISAAELKLPEAA
jgi:hypothetical protein